MPPSATLHQAKIKRKRGRHEANLGGHLEEKEVKLMKKKKVKTRTTRSQCQSAHRRTRDEKRLKEWSKEKVKTRTT
ncbi:Respiratory burst oxidase [Trichinella pseudospiralis]